MKKTITIFTPTYNRADLLINLYESLANQSERFLEWIIVDDGSVDNTKQVVYSFIEKKNSFKIRYFYQKNAGKHIAINKGVDLAKGDMFFIVDSDDVLIETAVERIYYWLETVDWSQKKFAGISGLRGFNREKLIGTTFSGEFIDINNLERRKNGITGDKAEIYCTQILRKYPFPQFQGEKFLPELTVWNKIASKGYLLRFFNEIIYITEYREGGLTDRGLEIYKDNWNGYTYFVKQEASYRRTIGKLSIYITYNKLAKEKHYTMSEVANYLEVSKMQVLCFNILEPFYSFALLAKKKVKSRASNVEQK